MISLPVDQWPTEPTVIDGWLYDRTKPELVIGFFQDCLKHGTGTFAGQPFVPLPWQKQIIYDLFGTLDPETGYRRYRIAYIEVPRKNGKSQFAAGLALWLLCGDGEQGSQNYSAALTREQASLVFKMAAQMVRADNALLAHCKVRDTVKTIRYPQTDSFYRAIPRDDAGAHGFNAHGIIFDEVHNQPDRKLWDALQTSTGMRTQPLTLAITTAGWDRSSICWELHRRSEGILEGVIEDPAFYPVIYSAGVNDDWTDPEIWAKANPSLGETVRIDYLQQECERAKQSPSYENTFKNLHLNMWTEQAVRWLPMDKWDKCEGETDIPNLKWHLGIDLAQSRDVPALMLAAKHEDKYLIKSNLSMPRESGSDRTEQDKRQLYNWSQQGHITALPCDVVTTNEILPYVWEILNKYDVETIVFAPWNAKELLAALERDGYPSDRMIKFPQTITHFTEPTKTFLDLVVTGRLIHDGNHALRWMASNVVIKKDANNNIRPMKDKSQDKIDGVVAAIMALREATIPTNELMPAIF